MTDLDKKTTLTIVAKNATSLFISGVVGDIDCLRLNPSIERIKGVALVFHPDPKGGGSNTNKVVQTVARALNQKGYICYCPNLRGVGLSDGVHDNGIGEIEDAKAVHQYIAQTHPGLPFIVAGFSFGAFIASSLASLVEHNKLILIGPAVTRYSVDVSDPNRTIVVHGQNDDVISVDAVFKWGEEHDQSITWFPNTGHFFHGKLVKLQNLLNSFDL